MVAAAAVTAWKTSCAVDLDGMEMKGMDYDRARNGLFYALRFIFAGSHVLLCVKCFAMVFCFVFWCFVVVACRVSEFDTIHAVCSSSFKKTSIDILYSVDNSTPSILLDNPPAVKKQTYHALHGNYMHLSTVNNTTRV